MAEPFNPNAFRQQMSRQGQSHNPVSSQAQPVDPQSAGYTQPFAPQQTYPAPHPQAGQPQAGHPQAGYPQQGYPQPQNFQAPKPQNGQGVPQPYTAQPYAAQQWPQDYSQMQPETQTKTVSSKPASKLKHLIRKLFKRETLKADMPAGPSDVLHNMVPQNMTPKNMVPQNMGLQNTISTDQIRQPKRGLSRLMTFIGGVGVGVLGTVISIVLFTPTAPQQAIVAENSASAPLSDKALNGSQAALTDDMLLKDKIPG